METEKQKWGKVESNEPKPALNESAMATATPIGLNEAALLDLNMSSNTESVTESVSDVNALVNVDSITESTSDSYVESNNEMNSSMTIELSNELSNESKTESKTELRNELKTELRNESNSVTHISALSDSTPNSNTITDIPLISNPETHLNSSTSIDSNNPSKSNQLNGSSGPHFFKLNTESNQEVILPDSETSDVPKGEMHTESHSSISSHKRTSDTLPAIKSKKVPEPDVSPSVTLCLDSYPHRLARVGDRHQAVVSCFDSSVAQQTRQIQTTYEKIWDPTRLSEQDLEAFVSLFPADALETVYDVIAEMNYDLDKAFKEVQIYGISNI